ncbi:MAG: NAD(P)H-binding protein [Polyangiaceae bacterium]|nr:NAD(P)H-binding protein [Polyangiaceae bacterium]
MKVLVIAGTKGITASVVSALLGRGHSVRLLARRAAHDAQAWASGVEPFEADIAEPDAISGCAEGCEVALYLDGDDGDSNDAQDGDGLNQSLKALVDEADRAGVRRFVHATAHEGGIDNASAGSIAEVETIVKAFSGESVVCEGFDVYGPQEGKIALLLKMVRTLPAVPVRAGAKRAYRPLWVEDFAQAIAAAAERGGISGRSLTFAGSELVTEEELLDYLAKITDRSPAKLPVPELVASLGARLGELLHVGGLNGGTNGTKNGAPKEASGAASNGAEEDGAATSNARGNDLVDVLGVQPTPLAEGLRKLADALPEILPSQGVGALKHKRFWTHIHNCQCSAADLFRCFQERFGEVMPIEVGVEPGTPLSIVPGVTLTLAMPFRGHLQVRVDEVTESSITIVTVEGHALAGAVRFAIEDGGGFVRAEVEVCDRAATRVDQLLMRAFGDFVQNANWREVLKRIAALGGGTMKGGVRYEAEELDDEDAKRLEDRLEELVMRRRREHGDIEAVRATETA